MPLPKKAVMKIVRNPLLDVLPVSLFQRIRNAKEKHQEDQNTKTHLPAKTRRRLPCPDEETHQIFDLFIVLSFLQLSWNRYFQCVRFMIEHLLALQLPKRMRHGNTREECIVPPGRTLFVTVE